MRCEWTQNDPLMNEYHDHEWGKPLHDDFKLFEFLVLDAFQAGLSWKTILYRRVHFKKAFAGFDPVKISRFTEKKLESLMLDASIIRNRLKIWGTVKNARAFLLVQKEFGSFDNYIWQFVDHQPIINKWKSMKEIPATSKESDMMSKDLKKRGFTFVGSTICYAFMQAAGMVNDHLVTCDCYKKVQKK
ncbi:MAG: DNA-3-methyladenine glycosylase I [Bacteroidota bacterium]|nr:DNA-3-methyladenine glycosylase I [Bacteroidota bacterium]